MNIRYECYDILKKIIIDGKYSHLTLKNSLQTLKQVDKNFVCNITYGVIQNYNYLKYNWEDLVKKQVNKEVEIILNIGVYQIYFMDKVPVFAAINETVDVAKKEFGSKIANFVNAILRKIAKRSIKEITGSREEKLSIKTSIPVWLIKMWNKQYGIENCEKICLDSLEIPKTYIRVNNLKGDISEKLLKNEFLSTDNKNSYEYIGENNIIDTHLFKEGHIIIQDYASQLVVNELDLEPDNLVLDMCAAPGSKTAQIVDCMNNKGKVIALELHEHRCKLIRDNMEKLNCKIVDVYQCDSTNPSIIANMKFDRILLDAPCTGYGVLKRKSDIKLNMQPEDMDGIIEIQEKLLESAAKLLDINGILVYSTCTLNKKENDLQINNFLDKHDNFKLIDKKTIMPFEKKCDGFFMAKMIKVR